MGRILLLLGIAGSSLAFGPVWASDEGAFMEPIRPPLEQAVGHGRTALWTLPLVATQYQPSRQVPAMQKALQAQEEGRFLHALILLEEARKSGQADEEAKAELALLHASFLLQGGQLGQALEILAPLQAQPAYAADAYSLTAMAHLQQGHMREAREAAQHARDKGEGVLPHLALSYALQGEGRLAEALEAMRGINRRTPQAVSLAREAELALTLDRAQAANASVRQAREMDAAHPYVNGVSGLAWLINGQTEKAKQAFETALRRDPKDPKALLGQGLAEIKLGHLQEGQEKLLAANDADPDNALILTYLGRAQQQSGQTAAAMASWRSAQQADPKDPTPWLCQAQAELQDNRLPEARESLHQAQDRTAYRSVYRGEHLLKEDEQLLRANLAEVQRRQGLETIAFHTLSDPVGEKNSATLRNQADLLQGRRFGESARRSLLLQSLFNERPGNLPSELDIYGDGAGQTGAQSPQHGVVSGLTSQQASYQNYDALFGQRIRLEADTINGNQSTSGEQLRLGAGNDTLGLGIAQRELKTDGHALYENLNNRVAQGIVQWRPHQSTQAFASYQTFDSRRGEALFPGDPGNMAVGLKLEDSSRVTRYGLRHSMEGGSELRALWSRQQTDQVYSYLDFFDPAIFYGSVIGNSSSDGGELQYRSSGAGHATQWGVQRTRAHVVLQSEYTRIAQQFYAACQHELNPNWQLDAQLGWGKIEKQDNTGGGRDAYLKRWLPKLGLTYSPDKATHVRLAVWHGMGFGEAGDASLAPASLAGFLLARPDDNKPNGMLVHAAALSADRQLSSAWLLEGQVQQRRTDEVMPPSFVDPVQTLVRRQMDESRVALHWQPEGRPYIVSLAWEYERFQAPPFPSFIENNSIQEQRFRAQQLNLRWLAGEQWTVNLALSHNRVENVMQTFFGTMLTPYQASFNQADASLSWQFARRGSLAAGVRNTTDKRFQATDYTNVDALTPRFSNGRLVYAGFRLAL